MPEIRFSDLSVSRRVFVRQCQRLGFGKITSLTVSEADPVFTQATDVFMDVKLDNDDSARPEQSLADFVLPAETVRFFAQLDTIGNGVVEHVEIRAGVPRRMLFKAASEKPR